ncbi:hypothetical protein BDW75DRAFT_226156 [Aspergillus navahoensis]
MAILSPKRARSGPRSDARLFEKSSKPLAETPAARSQMRRHTRLTRSAYIMGPSMCILFSPGREIFVGLPEARDELRTRLGARGPCQNVFGSPY